MVFVNHHQAYVIAFVFQNNAVFFLYKVLCIILHNLTLHHIFVDQIQLHMYRYQEKTMERMQINGEIRSFSPGAYLRMCVKGSRERK
jgi:hypothetical protein